MDPANYYITTITNAFKTLAPYIAFILGGYFIFIKMPFLFLKKSMDDQKKKLDDEKKDPALSQDKYTVDNYLEFQRKLKLMNGESAPKKETKSERRQETRSGQKNDSKREEKKEQPKKEQTKKEPPKRPHVVPDQSPEEIFNLRSGESITKVELKKRYFELLKQNHPDRVASMGEDFKKLAEKNTKEINKAYDKLKLKAS